jgi:hypothetical protein
MAQRSKETITRSCVRPERVGKLRPCVPLHARCPRQLFCEPRCNRGFVEFASCDLQHRMNGFIRRDNQIAAVQCTEHREGLPRQALVAIGQRMVTSDPYDEDSGLVHELRIEVVVAEAGLGCMECRVEQLESRRSGESLGAYPVDNLRDG